MKPVRSFVTLYILFLTSAVYGIDAGISGSTIHIKNKEVSETTTSQNGNLNSKPEKQNEIRDKLQKNATTDTSSDQQKQLKQPQNSPKENLSSQQKNLDESNSNLNNSINDSQHNAQ